MSYWSSCNAILAIHTYKTIPDFEKFVSEMLSEAPEIIGSEGNCEYIPIQFIEGHSTNADCNRCQRLKICINKYGCNPPTMKNCISGRYVDRCKIIIASGHGLRDKQKDETLTEFRELLKFLRNYNNKTFSVEVITKSIN